MKTCNDCQIEKPLSDFYKNKAYKDGYMYYCKPCQKARVYSSPNFTKNSRKGQLKKLYNTTPEHYDELFKKQKGVCGICYLPEQGKREYLCIDHDHNTGFIRGLLCHNCNIGIGKLRDNIAILKSAIWYLEKSQVELENQIRNTMTNNLEETN